MCATCNEKESTHILTREFLEDHIKQLKRQIEFHRDSIHTLHKNCKHVWNDGTSAICHHGLELQCLVCDKILW